MEPIAFGGKFEVQDHRRALFLQIKPRPAFLWALAVMAALIGLFVVAVALSPPIPSAPKPEPPGPLLILRILALLAWMPLYWFVYMPWRLRRLVAQTATAGLWSECRADEHALHVKSARGEARLPWSDFRRWRADAQLVLLYVNDVDIFIVPRHLFVCDEDFALFRSLVAAKVPAFR